MEENCSNQALDSISKCMEIFEVLIKRRLIIECFCIYSLYALWYNYNERVLLSMMTRFLSVWQNLMEKSSWSDDVNWLRKRMKMKSVKIIFILKWSVWDYDLSHISFIWSVLHFCPGLNISNAFLTSLDGSVKFLQMVRYSLTQSDNHFFFSA